MTEPKKKMTGKERARRNKIRKYLSEKAFGVYFLVFFVLVLIIGYVFAEYVYEWYLNVLYVAGFFAIVGIVILSDGNIGFISSGSSSYSNRNRRPNNGKTLFSSGTKQKSGWNSVGYNDDYERGNREIWKNKWDQEAWNDHEYSCKHDDPWECRDDEHF